MGLGSGRIPRLPHGTFRCVAGGVSLEPVPLGQGPHFGGHPGIFYPNTPMQINDPERTRQAAPELRLDAPGADDFTEHPLSMNGEAPAGKSVRNGKGAPAAPSFSCSTSCPLSHVPQKAWLHLFRVPFRKRHPVIFWGLLILLLGGIAALTGAIVILTGIAGNLLAEVVCKIFHITDPIAKGVGIGTSAHAVGTSKALQMGEVEGAMSGLSIAVAGVLTAVLCPFFVSFIQ